MLLARRTLLLRVPSQVRITPGGDLEYGGPWTRRRADARILDDLHRVQDDVSAVHFARRYGKFAPPDFYWPAAEPVTVLLHWAQYLPAVVLGCQLVRLGRPLPKALRSALGSPRIQNAEFVSAVAGFNLALWSFRLVPQLTFEPETRRWLVSVASGRRGEVDCALAACLHFALLRIAQPPDELHFAECAACQRVFQPERAPAAGRDSFCPDCRGTAAMWRVIKRRQRARG